MVSELVGEAAASATVPVVIFAGDSDFVFTLQELRPLSHAGYQIVELCIDTSFGFGFLLTGLSDDGYCSSPSHAVGCNGILNDHRYMGS